MERRLCISLKPVAEIFGALVNGVCTKTLQFFIVSRKAWSLRWDRIVRDGPDFSDI